MSRSFTFMFVISFGAILACGTPAAPADGGHDGGDGVCCPLMDPCTVGGNGGWAPTEAMCETGRGNDGEFVLETDDHGCEVWTGQGFCPGAVMCCTR